MLSRGCCWLQWRWLAMAFSIHCSGMLSLASMKQPMPDSLICFMWYFLGVLGLAADFSSFCDLCPLPRICFLWLIFELLLSRVLETLAENKVLPGPFYGLENKCIIDIAGSGREHYTFWFFTKFQRKLMLL